MKSAAQLDLPPDLAPSDGLREQAARRLAEHRARRARPAAAPDDPPPAPPTPAPRSRKAEVAAAVAERYRNSPTYRSVLAEESQRALHAAEAAAEVASINARAIARAQQQLLEELGDWHEPRASLSTISLTDAAPAAPPVTAAAAAIILAQQKAVAQRTSGPSVPSPEPTTSRDILSEDFAEPIRPLAAQQPASRPVVTERSTPSYTVRLYEDAGRLEPPPPAPSRAVDLDPTEAMLLDEEIAFRYDPVLADAAPPEPLPANLIEFPRQLVAARKARPRLAEGPLRDEDLSGTQDGHQLRIFEVEADHISAAPDSLGSSSAAAPEWSSILLSPQPVNTYFEPLDTDYTPSLVPRAASFSRRLLAATVDLCLIASCTLSSIGLFVLTVTHLTHTPIQAPYLVAAAVGLASLVALAALYHLLFFSLSDSTPGMRYARVAFCTLADENPTRAEVRRRLIAVALSALPLGLGYLWAFFDEDGLGWHDRVSRMYPRSY